MTSIFAHVVLVSLLENARKTRAPQRHLVIRTGGINPFDFVDDSVADGSPVCDRDFSYVLQGSGNFTHDDGQLAHGSSKCLSCFRVLSDALK